MTANEFRRLALSFPEAIEPSHMHHPNFRVGGKIFATLGYPGKDWGVVKLTPDQQTDFVQRYPNIFQPVKGAWGRRGNTNAYLAEAKSDEMTRALGAAFRNTAPKRLVKRL